MTLYAARLVFMFELSLYLFAKQKAKQKEKTETKEKSKREPSFGTLWPLALGNGQNTVAAPTAS